jgi:hypothetical protein
VGTVSDSFTSVTCQFSADCCNNYEEYYPDESRLMRQSGRRLSEMRGAVISAETWELNVIHVTKTNTFKAVVQIKDLKFRGNEGEAMIRDPRDFNSYRDVIEALNDPRRRRYRLFGYVDCSIFLGQGPADSVEEDFNSQPNVRLDVC